MFRIKVQRRRLLPSGVTLASQINRIDLFFFTRLAQRSDSESTLLNQVIQVDPIGMDNCKAHNRGNQVYIFFNGAFFYYDWCEHDLVQPTGFPPVSNLCAPKASLQPSVVTMKGLPSYLGPFNTLGSLGSKVSKPMVIGLVESRLDSFLVLYACL